MLGGSVRGLRALFRAALRVVAATASLALQGQAAAGQRLADELGHRLEIARVEVYHLEHRGLRYRVRVAPEYLTTATGSDYVRLERNNNSEVFREAMEALGSTVVAESVPCRQNTLDNRWAIVLTYSDGAKDLISSAPEYNCIQLSNREKPVTVSLDRMTPFLVKNFPFMHLDQLRPLQ